MAENSIFLRPSEAAPRLLMSPSAVMRLIQGRKLPACKIGKRWVIPADALETFIQNKNSEALSRVQK